MSTFTRVRTAFGELAFCTGRRGLTGLILPPSGRASVPRAARQRWPEAEFHAELWPELQRLIVAYFAGQRVSFRRIPVELEGHPPFRLRVLEACRGIPHGQRRTYAQLAGQVGSPRAARAVGQALAANPIPLIIPCHRIVGADGRMTGFSATGGIDLKRRLLELEARGRSGPA